MKEYTVMGEPEYIVAESPKDKDYARKQQLETIRRFWAALFGYIQGVEDGKSQG